MYSILNDIIKNVLYRKPTASYVEIYNMTFQGFYFFRTFLHFWVLYFWIKSVPRKQGIQQAPDISPEAPQVQVAKPGGLCMSTFCLTTSWLEPSAGNALPNALAVSRLAGPHIPSQKSLNSCLAPCLHCTISIGLPCSTCLSSQSQNLSPACFSF